MKNKRWTAQIEITKLLIKSREKRKWQIALRRYVLEGNKSSFYAPFFGIGIKGFKQWIEIQFDVNTEWRNFGKNWRLDHIIPVEYFDFDREEDMKLCWSFINIQVKKISGVSSEGIGVDLICAKAHFEKLYNKTGFGLCSKMVSRIEEIEKLQQSVVQKLGVFLKANELNINTTSCFSSYEYDQLNSGISLEEIMAEKEVLKKYGGQ